jgi:CRAL/TRIO, N-terminal domain
MTAVESESATPTNDLQALENLKLDEKSEPPAPAEERPATTNPHARRLPFEAPAPSARVPERPQLTAEEQAKYDEVLAYMKAIGELPTSSAKKNKEKAPLSDVEKYFLSRECILRYLRATKWNVVDAKKRLEGTIVWRREYGTDTSLTADVIEPEVLRPIPRRPMTPVCLLDGVLMVGAYGETNVDGIR